MPRTEPSTHRVPGAHDGAAEQVRVHDGADLNLALEAPRQGVGEPLEFVLGEGDGARDLDIEYAFRFRLERLELRADLRQERQALVLRQGVQEASAGVVEFVPAPGR